MILSELLKNGAMAVGFMIGGHSTPSTIDIPQPFPYSDEYDVVRGSVVAVENNEVLVVELNKESYGRIDYIYEPDLKIKVEPGDVIETVWDNDDMKETKIIKYRDELTTNDIDKLPPEVKINNDYYLTNYTGDYTKED